MNPQVAFPHRRRRVLPHCRVAIETKDFVAAARRKVIAEEGITPQRRRTRKVVSIKTEEEFASLIHSNFTSAERF